MKKRGLFLVSVLFLVLLIRFSSASLNDTNELLINEFVTDPQSSWGSDGNQWAEIYNPSTSQATLTDWSLILIDKSGTMTKFINATIPSNGYLVIPFSSQLNDGRIELHNDYGDLVDSVSYGNYEDNNKSDNAPNGKSSNTYDECVARYPNGVDTRIDFMDFIKTKCTYNSENNFIFVSVNISDFSASPSCALESSDITLSAHIIGSIKSVSILLSIDGISTEVSLPGNQSGNYAYIIDSSELTGSTTAEWQFKVIDLKNDITLGLPNTLPVFSITHLEVAPSEADGSNNWYISQPQFTLSNPDANQTIYNWGEGNFVYSIPFGLENTPNGGNITGGIFTLHYSSDICNEPEQTFTGKFDFKDPRIMNLQPTPNSTNLNIQNFTIGAHLDDTYNGNSGINTSSIITQIDGEVVLANIEQSGIDADVSYSSALEDGSHEVSIYAEDNSGRSVETSWSFTLSPLYTFEMQVNSPLDGIYSDKRIQFNISLSRTASILGYTNENDAHPQFKRLCTNCNSFGLDITRFKSLNEGQNNLIFYAEDEFDNVIEKSVLITIDSKSPRITKTLPMSGFASGEFTIEFEEENPQTLLISYGNSEIGYRSHLIDIQAECVKNGKYVCRTIAGLSDYDGTEIEYSAVLQDIAGNIEESRTRTLDVDISDPIINQFDWTVEGKYAWITLSVTESYLDEITYIDNLSERPIEKRLCNSLQGGICSKRISLDEGAHEIIIKVKDKAGNFAEVYTTPSFTDSKSPRIKSTLPARGFASGEFTIEFEEENPQESYLIYGTPENTRFASLNLSNCEPDRKNEVCSITADLADFEESSIFYYFNLTDKVGNSVQSRVRELQVDTMPPQITEFNYTTSERRVEFTIGVLDPNFDKVLYKDSGDSNPQFKALCTTLNNGICQKSKLFKIGSHTIDIIAVDKAGNQAEVVSGLEFLFNSSS
jgi:hypothetical protein